MYGMLTKNVSKNLNKTIVKVVFSAGVEWHDGVME